MKIRGKVMAQQAVANLGIWAQVGPSVGVQYALILSPTKVGAE